LFDLVFTRAEQTEVGLVLSGGGAKVLHIGVLKVLEEAGLKIDYIGGTSMGLLLVGCMHQDIPQLKLILFFNRQILMN
jgi:NTE family protein